MSDRSMIDAVPRGEYVPTADQRVVLSGLTWADFESFLAVRGDAAGPRVTYLEGTLELMSPSRNHESLKKRLAVIVEAYFNRAGIRYDGAGSWLVKHAPSAGLEPDECYLVGDVSKDRPDLAIEIVWTSGGIDKLEVYRRLGVPEVWFWIDGAIRIYVLADDGYEPSATSRCVPRFDPALAAELLELDTLADVHREAARRIT